MKQLHQVVIVGGGFGGLKLAKSLKKVPVDVTMLDRRNFHLFQPLLYQIATGGLSPANIATPLRSVLKRHKNVEVLVADVQDFDVANRQVICREGKFPYDTLIVAAGVRHQYFGHLEWEPSAPGLKTLEDATTLRRRILGAFEAAEREDDEGRRKALMTFVVIGGGPTGVEMAGAISELAHHTLKQDFRRITTSNAKTFLLEGSDRILPSFPPQLSQKAEQALTRLGATVRVKAMVTNVHADSVIFSCNNQPETISAKTIIWAAGVQASPLGKALAKATGADLDRAGRVRVLPDLSLPNHPEIFVIGDLAYLESKPNQPLPGVAQVAMQQGAYVAKRITAQLNGKTLPPFQYKDRGSMATIGRNAAVVDMGSMRYSGFLGWLMWVFIHLLYIEQAHNRILILAQWAWGYMTWNRSARLITFDSGIGDPTQPSDNEPAAN